MKEKIIEFVLGDTEEGTFGEAISFILFLFGILAYAIFMYKVFG